MALSAKEAARELGTDARTFRKFMRSILAKEDQPGQGNRYAIEEKELKKLQKRFAEWNKPKATTEEVKASTNGATPKAKTKKKTKEVEAVDITDDPEVMVEPTDEELMDLDDAVDFIDLELD